MGSSSKLWAKAVQTAGPAAKDLKFDEDLGSVLDDMAKAADQYLALEIKLFRVARRLFTLAKKARRVADGDMATIREAAGAKSGAEKAALNTLLANVERAIDDMQGTSGDEVSFRMKREFAMAKRINRALK